MLWAARARPSDRWRFCASPRAALDDNLLPDADRCRKNAIATDQKMA
jgi:hypothetical protein